MAASGMTSGLFSTFILRLKMALSTAKVIEKHVVKTELVQQWGERKSAMIQRGIVKKQIAVISR